jgi:hypothetical protein
MARRSKKPQGVFGGEWREADLSYARKLVQRGLLDKDRLSWRDPTCRECGHRAMVHGFKNNSLVQVQPRWFRDAREGEEAVCEWPGCTCAAWRPELQARHPAEYTGEVLVTATWVEAPLDSQWVCAYRIINDHGAPVVGEVRIFPNEKDRPRLGDWSGDLCGATARVPRGGITTRQLDRVRLHEHLQFMSREVARFRAQTKDWAEHWGWGGGDAGRASKPTTATKRRGRKGRPDAFYADIAADYVLVLSQKSKRPVHDIAESRGINDAGKVRDMIREARKRKLLTAARHGVRGGDLTSVGRSLLSPGKRRAVDALPKSASLRETAARSLGGRIGPEA